MTIAEIINKLRQERDFGSRFPARIIFVDDLNSYSDLVSQLKSACDVPINLADFGKNDVVPQFEKMRTALEQYEGKQVLLLSVGEYLRMCIKRELNKERAQFPAFWECMQPESSKTRYIMPVFRCRDSFDRIIGKVDERQEGFIWELDNSPSGGRSMSLDSNSASNHYELHDPGVPYRTAKHYTISVYSVGHVKINAHELGIDFLSASAHKFNGPKGIGFLYIRKGVDLKPYADGGAQESAHRAGTENIASIVGMAAALKGNCDTLETSQKHLVNLEKLLLARLDDAAIAYKHNGGKYRLPGLLSLSFPGKDGEAILHRMDLMGICISTGSACNSKDTEISHVLKAIKLDEKYATGTIRISLGKYNTEDDVERIVQGLKKILL